MCGIVGYCRLKESDDLAPDLRRLNNLIAHRGPDSEGFYLAASVGLAMRRLSIIDLSTGQQPMTNEDGTLQLVFNGEIYNYRELRERLVVKGHYFTTQSDTEVVIHGYEEWGDTLPSYLQGMFAFAVWDIPKQRLFLARDHFGIKPLYYVIAGNLLIFASEIKALIACRDVPRDIDFDALNQYLSFLYIPEPRTIFKAVCALPAAHTLSCEQGHVQIKQYWSFHVSPNPYRSKPEAIEAIRTTFEASVQSMLVADVPLGAFLSGGIDSASIVAMITKHSGGQPVQTFSIGFGQDEHHWDELDAARKVAQFFKTDHHEFRVEPDVVSILPQVIAHFDQPFANPTALLLYLLSKETAQHVKVALAGTGGDEMFAGYPRYRGMRYYKQYRRLPVQLRQATAHLVGRVVRDDSNGRLTGQRMRRFFESGSLTFDQAYIRVMTVMEESRKLQLYTPHLCQELYDVEPFLFMQHHLQDESTVEPLERLMEVDVNTYLPFNQLAYGDRMSMAQSLEVRVPFVDQNLIEVAGAIPLSWKLSHRMTKGLFREAMAPVLPPEILMAPKQGLNLPISLWFRENLRPWVRDLLSPRRVAARGFFEPQALDTILSEHENGRRDHSLFIWALVVFELWQQLYLDTNVSL